MTSRTLLASTVLLAAVALAGCSNTDPAGTPGTGTTQTGSSAPSASLHNDADVAFASMMIPHHQQAVQMSDMLLAKRGVDAQITSLAAQIKAAQAPEITQMSGWLSGWGADPSPTSMGGMAGMDSGDGLMSPTAMDDLDKATGPRAETLFLSGMIEHHQGAVTMAQTELAQGRNPDAKSLAQKIITTQKAEITRMNELLGR